MESPCADTVVVRNDCEDIKGWRAEQEKNVYVLGERVNRSGLELKSSTPNYYCHLLSLPQGAGIGLGKVNTRSYLECGSRMLLLSRYNHGYHWLILSMCVQDESPEREMTGGKPKCLTRYLFVQLRALSGLATAVKWCPKTQPYPFADSLDHDDRRQLRTRALSRFPVEPVMLAEDKALCISV